MFLMPIGLHSADFVNFNMVAKTYNIVAAGSEHSNTLILLLYMAHYVVLKRF